jgi:glycerophosphoryl diester phosphodiesterase
MRPALPPAFLSLPIAHRALHDRAQGRIENSPAAIEAAIVAGYAIEIDIQLSVDGVPMVFHDETLERLTGETGPLNQRLASDLNRITLTGSDDTIPSLDHVLAQVAGRVPLLIELKDQTLTLGETDGRLEQATARSLTGYEGPVALMSFNPHCMIHMARLAPHMARGLTTAAFAPADWAPVPAETCNRLREIPDYDAAGASFISHEARDLSRPRVRDLKSQGAHILCWTIRSPMDEAEARRIAENITFESYLSPIPA